MEFGLIGWFMVQVFCVSYLLYFKKKIEKKKREMVKEHLEKMRKGKVNGVADV